MTEKPIESPAPHASLPARALATITTLRWPFLVPVPIAILVVRGFFSPDGWREPLTWLLWMSTACVVAAMAHAMRRILLPKLDLNDFLERARQGNVAASIVAFGAMVFMAWAFSSIISLAKAQDVRTYIPANAVALLPELRRQQQGYWPDHPAPSYFGGLIEHESCISLTHSRCWNPRAQLKTAREEGASLGQFTRAWRADGTLRFDAIAEVKALDPTALAEFSWATVYSRADLSMRAILVKQRDADRRLALLAPAMSRADRMAMADASYNGGMGGLLSDRKICAATAGCDPNRWFGHVERHSLKSRVKWQGYGKSAFEINRFHVTDVLLTRRPKYMAALGADRA